MAVIHHPAVLDIPSLAAQNTSAKLSYLTIVYLTPDPLLQEISSVELTGNFMRVNSFPSEMKSITSQAKESLEYITHTPLSKSIKDLHKRLREDSWITHLNSLEISVIQWCLSLEKENRAWARIMVGMLVGQLSFILHAGSDTLP